MLTNVVLVPSGTGEPLKRIRSEPREQGCLMIRRICVGMLLALALLMPIRAKAAPQSTRSQGANGSATCPVTVPRKDAPPNEGGNFFEPGASHSKPTLSVGLWPDGTVVFQPGGPGSIEPDGSLSMKFPWWREAGLRGRLTIHGRRLDAPAPPLRAHIPWGYGDTGFQSTALILPTEGCWEVTGQVADTRLTFVTHVVRVGERK